MSLQGVGAQLAGQPGLRTARPVNWPPAPTQSAADAKADLRAVHWQTSFRPLQPSRSDSKLQYIHHKGATPGLLSEATRKDLRAVHWNTGVDKEQKVWKSTGAEELARHEDAKYKAEQPKDMKHLGAELRKTNIPFSCRPTPTGQSEKASRFQGEPVQERAAYLGDILGKDLKASHIDFANGNSHSVKDWQGMQAAEMSRHEDAKFACKRQGAARDTKELRVSSVPLGSIYEY